MMQHDEHGTCPERGEKTRISVDGATQHRSEYHRDHHIKARVVRKKAAVP